MVAVGSVDGWVVGWVAGGRVVQPRGRGVVVLLEGVVFVCLFVCLMLLERRWWYGCCLHISVLCC